jgi:hypothetical protein
MTAVSDVIDGEQRSAWSHDRIEPQDPMHHSSSSPRNDQAADSNVKVAEPGSSMAPMSADEGSDAAVNTAQKRLADQAAREEELVLKLRAQATENQQVVAQLDALAVQARAAQQSEAKYREKLQQLAAESDRAIAAANAATSDAVQKGEQLAHDVDMQRKAMRQAESELAALREQLADVKAAGSLTVQQLALKEVKLHALEKVIQDGVEVWPCDLCGLGCEKSQLKLHWVGCRMSLAAEVRLSCAAQLCRSSTGMQTRASRAQACAAGCA